MMQYNMVQATRIAEAVEQNIADLIGKLCEGEPPEVSDMVWAMVTTKLLASCTWGSCFRLPPLEEC